jgi:ribose transport system permease protein
MMFKQSLFPCLIAWGISFNMTMGVFDLSPGSIIVLSGIIGGNLALSFNMGMPGLLLFTVIIAAILCTVNCLVFVKMRIPSMILSLGMLMIYETLTAILYEGKGVTIPTEWRLLYSEPYIYIVFVLMFVVLFYINRYTKFAYDVRSLGNGTGIAMNIGVDLTKTRFKSFCLEGILLGLAAVIDMSMTGSEKATQSMASCSTAFAAIMAVFVGIYLAKYCGIMMGTFIGAFSLKILASGTLALGLSAQMQKVSNGIFLIVFVGLSQNLGRIAEQRERRKKQKLLFAQIEGNHAGDELEK